MMLVAPVGGMFDGRMLLMGGKSIDMAQVPVALLLGRNTEVTATGGVRPEKLFRTMFKERRTREESLVQSVAETPVARTLACSDPLMTAENPVPLKVTLVDPVVGRFLGGLSVWGRTASRETTQVMVAILRTTVKAISPPTLPFPMKLPAKLTLQFTRD